MRTFLHPNNNTPNNNDQTPKTSRINIKTASMSSQIFSWEENENERLKGK